MLVSSSDHSDAQLCELASSSQGLPLGDRDSLQGVKTGKIRLSDGSWSHWEPTRSGAGLPGCCSAREWRSLWEHGLDGSLDSSGRTTEGRRRDSQGHAAWGRRGVAVSQMRDSAGDLAITGDLFDSNVAALSSRRTQRPVAAIWAFAAVDEYSRQRAGDSDQKLTVTNATLIKVPFDLEHWSKVAAEQYPDGLPEPHSDDPTQWLFKGTVAGSEAPLQVAVARLLGYRWPDQEPDALDALADADGLVPLPAVGGERPAAERLRAPARPRLRRRVVAGAARPPPRRDRLARQDPRRLAARRLLRPAHEALPQPPLHLARLGRPQGRLQRPLSTTTGSTAARSRR